MQRRRRVRELAFPAREGGHEPPQAVDHRIDIGEQRPLDADRVVESRLHAFVARAVVEDVDAADEAHATVDQRDLAMQASQPAATELQPPALGTEAQHDDARGLHAGDERRRQLAGAEAIDQKSHPRAARRGPRERVGDGTARVVVLENVGLEPHVRHGRVDGRDERREELRPVEKERESVAGDEIHGRPARQRRKVAASATWSDRRDQKPPRGAAPRRPRVRARRCGRARASGAAPGSCVHGARERCGRPPPCRARARAWQWRHRASR